MVSILNKNLKDTNKLKQELTKILGVGIWKAKQICAILGLNPNIRVNEISLQNIDQLNNLININHYTGSELQKLIKEDVARLIRIGTYKGFRHIQKLPVRGQRTHTNAKTVKKFTRY
jgi:small subunit ribosomal protein S13